MKNTPIFTNKFTKGLFLFALLILTFAVSSNFAQAAVGVGSWTSNNNTVLTIDNGQSAQFTYGVTAVTQLNGRYSIMLYRSGVATPIRTYSYNVPTLNNIAQGYITVNPIDYANTIGSYYIIIRSSDNFGTDDFRLNLNVQTPIVPPAGFSATCFAVPVNGYSPLNVALNAQVTGPSNSYSYNWNFNDGTTSTTPSTASLTDSRNHVFTTGVYNPFVSIRNIQTNEVVIANCPTITSIMPTLTIETLNCFARVVDGQNQSCSVHVSSNNGQVAGNVNVNVYYQNGNLFGSCVTNAISGSCEIQNRVTGVGTYNVYATATASGYVSDTDRNPTYTFEVFRQRYQILNLGVYKDSNYNIQSNSFYRGEALYVRFQVYDTVTNSFVQNDIITQAALVSLAGGRADLDRTSFGNNWYYYRLNSIPLNHGFFGSSNVFAFAFNFADNSGGQAQVSLNILNNKPTINNIPDTYVSIGQTIYIDLNNYGRDLEDSTLNWQILSSSNIVNTNLGNGNILSIQGLNLGLGTITIRAYDLDNEFAQTTFNVFVVRGIGNNNTNSTPQINIGGPYVGFINEPLTFDASLSQGDIVKYSWTFGDGSSQDTISPTVIQTYNRIDKYDVTLTLLYRDGKTLFAKTFATIIERTRNNTINQTTNSGTIGSTDKGLEIRRLDLLGNGGDEVLEMDDDLTVNVNVKNNYKFKVDDATVRIEIRELGIFATSQSFDLSKGETEDISVNLPMYDVPKGIYNVKIMVGNSEVRRIKYREIIVK